MGIPAGFSFYPITLHRLKAREDVFNGPGHDMVYAGHTIRRRWPFIKNIVGLILPALHTFLKDLRSIPELENTFSYPWKIKAFIFFKTFGISHRLFRIKSAKLVNFKGMGKGIIKRILSIC